MTCRFRVGSVLAAAIALGIACGAGDAAGGSEREAKAQPIPLLVPWSPPSIDRDLPPVILARLEQEQRRLMTRVRAAAKQPATAAAGCAPSDDSSHLGPPAPSVTAQIIGHHVEVQFAYNELPSSDACRPFQLTVVTYAGAKASPTYKNFVAHFLVTVPRGRVVVDLPWGSRPPYHLIVSPETIVGRRGRAVEGSLPCPATRDLVKGCLPGYRPGLHSYPMPTPVLPLRGIDRPTLEASLRYVLAQERQLTPRASRCPSLRVCEITYVDPAFPRSPYRVRYRIAGEQIPGCWMGLRQPLRSSLPYPDAGQGRLELAGCSTWLR